MFTSALQKIERANKHISDLKAAFDLFTKAHPHTLSFSTDPQTGAMTVEVHFREEISTDFALMIGDAAHNLRSALDHAAWELVGLDRGAQDRYLAFPVSKTNRSDYEATCNGVKTPRADTKQFFIAFAAYPSGAGHKIFGLSELDNADKHTVLTPIVGVAKIAHVKVLHPNGKLAATLDDTTLGMGPDGRARFMLLGPGMRVEFDQNADPTIDVFFGDVEVFKFTPIIQTLENLRDAVTDIIGQFDAFVKTRP